MKPSRRDSARRDTAKILACREVLNYEDKKANRAIYRYHNSVNASKDDLENHIHVIEWELEEAVANYEFLSRIQDLFDIVKTNHPIKSYIIPELQEFNNKILKRLIQIPRSSNNGTNFIELAKRKGLERIVKLVWDLFKKLD